MSGVDYFDYDGDCNINEKRDSVMGDVYHSQLVEVGKPDANVKFDITIKKLIGEQKIIIKASL